MKYGNRSVFERIAASPLALLTLVVIFCFLAKAAWNIHEKAKTSNERLAVEQAELAKLQKSQNDLSSQVSYLSTDQGIEAELRTKFKAVKDGEQVAVIVDNQPAAVAEATSTESALGWWGRFLRFFDL